jgi:DNA-binding IscR family transcriptional regulator
VAAIMEAIDGPRPRPFRLGRRGMTPADVALQTLWEKVSAALFVVVDGVTIEDLRRQASPDGGSDFMI